MYVIKTQRMCVYLQNKGFKLIKSVRDRNNPKYFVYLFEDTQETFNQYIQGISQGVVSKAELRQFIFSNESIEDSEKAVEKIESETDSVDKLLSDQENEEQPKEKDKEKVKEEGKDNEENND